MRIPGSAGWFRAGLGPGGGWFRAGWALAADGFGVERGPVARAFGRRASPVAHAFGRLVRPVGWVQAGARPRSGPPLRSLTWLTRLLAAMTRYSQSSVS